MKKDTSKQDKKTEGLLKNLIKKMDKFLQEQSAKSSCCGSENKDSKKTSCCG